jgi:hypothetical protein
MPSKDQMNEPAWRWLSDRARQRANVLGAKRAAASQIARSAAYVQELARRSGLDPEALAARIPADTLRRLKYPMIQQVNEDGTRSFEHDLGIQEGRKSLLATDRGTDGAYDAPAPRDESGRFIKK